MFPTIFDSALSALLFRRAMSFTWAPRSEGVPQAAAPAHTIETCPHVNVAEADVWSARTPETNTVADDASCSTCQPTGHGLRRPEPLGWQPDAIHNALG